MDIPKIYAFILIMLAAMPVMSQNKDDKEINLNEEAVKRNLSVNYISDILRQS